MMQAARAVARKVESYAAEETLLGDLEPVRPIQMLQDEPKTNRDRLVILGNALYGRMDQAYVA